MVQIPNWRTTFCFLFRYRHSIGNCKVMCKFRTFITIHRLVLSFDLLKMLRKFVLYFIWFARCIKILPIWSFILLDQGFLDGLRKLLDDPTLRNWLQFSRNWSFSTTDIWLDRLLRCLRIRRACRSNCRRLPLFIHFFLNFRLWTLRQYFFV